MTKVNSGHLARTHMQAPSFITRQWSLFLDCLHTHTLKTKTAGLKMGPCHSLLGVNLLCPQSCFSLSHSSPLHRVLIAHWISSSHCFVVFRKILLLPSATLPSDQQITSDLFSKGVIVLQPFIFPWLSKCAQLPLSCSFSFYFFASWWYFLSLLLTLYIYSKYVKLQVQSAKWHLLKFHSNSKKVLSSFSHSLLFPQQSSNKTAVLTNKLVIWIWFNIFLFKGRVENTNSWHDNVDGWSLLTILPWMTFTPHETTTYHVHTKTTNKYETNKEECVSGFYKWF